MNAAPQRRDTRNIGLPWLQEIPSEWSVRPLKFNLKLTSETPREYGRTIALENIEAWTGRFVQTGSSFDGRGAGFEADDVLFGKLRPNLAKVFLADEAGEAIGDLWVLRPQNECHPRFFFYQLLGANFIDTVSASTNGAKMPRADWSYVGALPSPTPDMDEQRTIASYLDRETARIDGLIEKKARFIALLKEKRVAVIAHAVTKGLNRDATMKDSGQDWLGKVPAHWDIKAAARLFTERDERSTSGDEELLTVSHLTGVTRKSEKTVHMIEAESHEGYKICEEGDLAVNTLWAWMGAMGTSPMRGIISPAYNVYTPGGTLDPAYVDAIVRLPIFAHEVKRFSKGVWSSRLRLYPEGFREVRWPVPPVAEQKDIGARLTPRLSRIDTLITKTERSIKLLKEKRAALITAAVTGKIDVRSAA